jgi:hypothetical protein
MLRDLTNKQKIVLLVVLILAVGPTWALSGPGMKYWIAKAKENDGRDPKSAERLVFLAKVYDLTWRFEEAKPLLHDWLIRYGGDEGEYPPNERMLVWEQWPYDEDHPRPAHHSRTPHPLTAQVICTYAEYWEKDRRYPESKHLFSTVIKRENLHTDKDALKRAESGIIRDRSRSF